ncbi:DUF2690 domain-containing protein [Actinomadura rupiterrae]|uniref:DUF2690 domain-containing protein n=1 Tax=Actinomadura rupiterrae TaxID=559627 RepID=UPI0020A3564E|nr:DUF2690 domain-containing protein [Actinomadura rupiterrae]MCP2342208.1 hypothetical protein [Actinomadura rupiterrae]
MRRVGLGLAAVVAAASGMLAVTPSAYAATCSGDDCNGGDPYKTGCDHNNYNAAPTPVTVFGGKLELRWGPDRSTNWTQFTPANGDLYEISVWREDNVWAGDGLYKGYRFSGAGIVHWSDQIYSPWPAAACVNDLTTYQHYCAEQTS